MIRRVTRWLMLLSLGGGLAVRGAWATDAGGAGASPRPAPAMAAGAGAGAGGAGALPRPATATAAGAGAGGAGGDAAKRVAALRHKVLKDQDFVEDEETNRDPFHSYLRLFAEQHGPARSRKLPSAFDKVGLEDLTLIAIVSGDEAPRAMFRDGSGYGQTVKKGDFLSRSGARVTKILSDRVIVEITETTGTGEPRVVEKAILVNPDEAP